MPAGGARADPDIRPFTTADVAGLSLAKAEPETQQKNAASPYLRNRKAWPAWGPAGPGAGDQAGGALLPARRPTSEGAPCALPQCPRNLPARVTFVTFAGC